MGLWLIIINSWNEFVMSVCSEYVINFLFKFFLMNLASGRETIILWTGKLKINMKRNIKKCFVKKKKSIIITNSVICNKLLFWY